MPRIRILSEKLDLPAIPWSARAGNFPSRDIATSQYASVPTLVLRSILVVRKVDEGNALIVTEVMTPKVEPPP